MWLHSQPFRFTYATWLQHCFMFPTDIDFITSVTLVTLHQASWIVDGPHGLSLPLPLSLPTEHASLPASLLGPELALPPLAHQLLAVRQLLRQRPQLLLPLLPLQQLSVRPCSFPAAVDRAAETALVDCVGLVLDRAARKRSISACKRPQAQPPLTFPLARLPLLPPPRQ
jgi:hypothetical protein